MILICFLVIRMEIILKRQKKRIADKHEFPFTKHQISITKTNFLG